MINTIISRTLLACSLLVSVAGFAQDQKTIDDNLIKDYLGKNHIPANKTASGLYYVIKQQGQGEHAKAGQKVSMLYSGKFLDGKKFDGNADDNMNPIPGKPAFNFTLGVGQVIKGWDEGVQLLNPGSKATIFLPSSIAYGTRGVGPIPPNTVLMFDVALLSIDK